MKISSEQFVFSDDPAGKISKEAVERYSNIESRNYLLQSHPRLSMAHVVSQLTTLFFTSLPYLFVPMGK